jgi:hypothetical protein
LHLAALRVRHCIAAGLSIRGAALSISPHLAVWARYCPEPRLPPSRCALVEKHEVRSLVLLVMHQQRHWPGLQVALFATSASRMLTARFIGYIRGPFGAGREGQASAAEGDEGQSASAQPVSLAFRPGFPEGSLLAVRWGSSRVGVVPLYH